jgi:DtxR family Mn-dependent transcriptional regulator
MSKQAKSDGASEAPRERAIEEILEALWTALETGATRSGDLNQYADVEVREELLRELEERSLIQRGRNGTLEFTAEGEARARGIIRRHRLAERLVNDILAMPMSEVEANACAFEHLVAPGITESICTLLGHPAECPHGRPIPEGLCCAEAKRSIEPVVVSADQMGIGERARVAYIATRDYARLQKLTSFGISPGVTVRLHQRQPAFVLECEQTQLALEEAVAKEIYVLREIQGR